MKKEAQVSLFVFIGIIIFLVIVLIFIIFFSFFSGDVNGIAFFPERIPTPPAFPE